MAGEEVIFKISEEISMKTEKIKRKIKKKRIRVDMRENGIMLNKKGKKRMRARMKRVIITTKREDLIVTIRKKEVDLMIMKKLRKKKSLQDKL